MIDCPTLRAEPRRPLLPALAIAMTRLALHGSHNDEKTVPRRTLLRSVAKYVQLTAGERLRGCADDVAVMRMTWL